MKVLFAVSNENISDSIVKKYQKDYKEIVSYKNVYYFNAIIKEIQRDKTYDRIVISEDLEPFANNDYEAIDRFIFEKLDSISDEATGTDGEDTPIILICSDRRTKSEQFLVKLFGIGIYSAVLGQDRSIDQVVKLVKKPRTKKEAKIYYKIESDDVSYQAENEDTVSEVEIQNIRSHYRKLGKNEDAYVESFNNIASQYTDAQLKVIIKFLPLNVKAVLERNSPKYQSIMAFSGTIPQTKKVAEKKEDALKIDFIENQLNKPKLTKPVIVPSAVNTNSVKKLGRTLSNVNKPKEETDVNQKVIDNKQETSTIEEDIDSILGEIGVDSQIDSVEEVNEKPEEQKRGRGRPKKIVNDDEQPKVATPKRSRGRPKKVSIQEEKNEEENEQQSAVNLFELDEEDESSNDNSSILPGFDDIEENTVNNVEESSKVTLPGFDDEEDDSALPGIEEKNEDTVLPEFDDEDENEINETTRNYQTNQQTNNFNSYNTQANELTSQAVNMSGIETLLSKDKKIVAFVGTSKNGTSFIINNLGELFSSMGINTAILDMTQNKNSYFIYTKNEEALRKVAYNSMDNLEKGIPEGIQVNKNLTVYTALPNSYDEGEKNPVSILETLAKNYSIVLIDCDFNTPLAYFDSAQEIYLVQSMDILTIQPLTAFLRDLKAKNILTQDKIKIVVNKEARIRGLTPKVIIGGMAYYNDPAMSFMTELFNKEQVKYITIPFDEQVYSKYLSELVDCKISLSGYSKNFMSALKELAGMVYPLINNKYKPSKPLQTTYEPRQTFSDRTNSTLDKMKNNY